MDLELVEAQQRGFTGDEVGERRDRVIDGGVVALDLMEAPMRVLHEFVEVDAFLARHLGGGEEQVHQHGFAAADITDDIEAVRVVLRLLDLLAVQEAVHPAVGGRFRLRVVVAQLGPQVLQGLGGAGLGGVGNDGAGGDAGPVFRDYARRNGSFLQHPCGLAQPLLQCNK